MLRWCDKLHCNYPTEMNATGINTLNQVFKFIKCNISRVTTVPSSLLLKQSTYILWTWHQTEYSQFMMAMNLLGLLGFEWIRCDPGLRILTVEAVAIAITLAPRFAMPQKEGSDYRRSPTRTVTYSLAMVTIFASAAIDNWTRVDIDYISFEQMNIHSLHTCFAWEFSV